MTSQSAKLELQTDDAVRERYSAASKEQEPALCCPVVYDRKFLEVIPQEIIDRDYGCGDPSPYVRPGDTVVDLGSGELVLSMTVDCGLVSSAIAGVTEIKQQQ